MSAFENLGEAGRACSEILQPRARSAEVVSRFTTAGLHDLTEAQKMLSGAFESLQTFAESMTIVRKNTDDITEGTNQAQQAVLPAGFQESSRPSVSAIPGQLEKIHEVNGLVAAEVTDEAQERMQRIAAACGDLLRELAPITTNWEQGTAPVQKLPEFIHAVAANAGDFLTSSEVPTL
jgi:hypothetical protein